MYMYMHQGCLKARCTIGVVTVVHNFMSTLFIPPSKSPNFIMLKWRDEKFRTTSSAAAGNCSEKTANWQGSNSRLRCSVFLVNGENYTCFTHGFGFGQQFAGGKRAFHTGSQNLYADDHLALTILSLQILFAVHVEVCLLSLMFCCEYLCQGFMLSIFNRPGVAGADL